MGLIFPIYRKLKISSYQKPLDRFQYDLAGMFLWWPSTKVVQAVMISSKNMAARGQGLFSLYIYIKNFKNLVVRNRCTEFNVTWQECCFGDPLPRLFKLSWFLQNMAAGGAGLFSLYIYIKNFKNLVVRNRWTKFNVTWQECCFGDPLPRLFKLLWFRQKHGHWGGGGGGGGGGAGLIFAIYLYKKLYQDCSSLHETSKNMAPRGWGLFSIYIYLYRNFKILLVKYLLTDFNNALVTLYQECSSNPDLSKNMAARGWGLLAHLSSAQDELLWSLFVRCPSVRPSVRASVR